MRLRGQMENMQQRYSHSLADWGNRRIFTEADPSDLIRHVLKRLSGTVLPWLAALATADEFQILPTATRIFCNTVASAEGTVKATAAKPPGPAGVADPMAVSPLRNAWRPAVSEPNLKRHMQTPRSPLLPNSRCSADILRAMARTDM